MSKINNYLPKILQDIVEFKIINEDLDVELGLLQKYINGVGTEPLIQEASAYGVEHWEKVLGILPKDSDSLEVRRFRVYNILISKLPYTVRWLRNKLVDLVGNKTGFTLNVSNTDYVITITLSGLNTYLMSEIYKNLRDAVPCNMKLEIGGPAISSMVIRYAIAPILGTKYIIRSRYNINDIVEEG